MRKIFFQEKFLGQFATYVVKTNLRINLSPTSWKSVLGGDLQFNFDRQIIKLLKDKEKHFEETIQRISLWPLGEKGTQKA